jgi:hypothetical protein
LLLLRRKTYFFLPNLLWILNDDPDEFVWGLTTSGTFTVKSMYLDLLHDDTKYMKKYVWKMKVPLKIKIFIWFRHRKVILTKDNLIKTKLDRK